jgi:hypothetical protein
MQLPNLIVLLPKAASKINLFYQSCSSRFLVFKSFDLSQIETVLFSCGDFIEKILTEEQFKASPYFIKESIP